MGGGYDASRTSGMDKLPIELASIILSYVPNARTLRALVLASPNFYHTFISIQRKILKDVLLNEFDESLLIEALITHRFAMISLSVEDHDNIIKQISSSEMSLPENWSLSSSLMLSHTLEDVEFFTKEFAGVLTRYTITDGICDSPVTLTKTEIHRIRRAFFRFEMFCNSFRRNLFHPMFPQQPHDSPSTLWCDKGIFRAFLKQTPIWETEQLATVYEYLLDRLSQCESDAQSRRSSTC